MARSPSQVATDLRALADEVAGLAAAAPPVVVPPVVLPPPAGPARLYVEGSKLKTKTGAPVALRCIEFMHNGNTAGLGAAELCARLKALGFNAISPLFQGTQGQLANVKALCDAARAAGLIVGVNGDHQTNGRAWLNDPAMVALLNGYDHVYLELEVETDALGAAESSASWAAGAKNLVAAVRAAGHKSALKVGAPAGGRDVMHPLAKGAEVLAADPLHNLLFTFQAYWKAALGGWHYSEANGFAPGLAGTKAALTACAASGLHFVPGFDWEDDVGLTGELELMDHAHGLGMSFAHWVLTGDFRSNNNMVDWDISLASLSANGAAIKAKMLAQRVMPAL